MAYAVTGWLVVMVGLAVYAVTLVARERRLAAAVPPERRRWLDTPDPSDD